MTSVSVPLKLMGWFSLLSNSGLYPEYIRTVHIFENDKVNQEQYYRS